MTTIMPTATKEYPLLIQVPEQDVEIWRVIVQNEAIIKALFESGVLTMRHGKATINIHEGHIQNVHIETRTYTHKVIPNAS